MEPSHFVKVPPMKKGGFICWLYRAINVKRHQHVRTADDAKTRYSEHNKEKSVVAHANCSRKRTSPWKNNWMSSIPYFSMAMRSTPMPKAKPETFSGS